MTAGRFTPTLLRRSVVPSRPFLTSPTLSKKELSALPTLLPVDDSDEVPDADNLASVLAPTGRSRGKQ
ncbi:hypothetical protein MY3296_002429 [Beauveria thailandica]